MPHISIYTTSTKTYVTEHAVLDYPYEAHGKNKWMNRPWYKYRYQSALYDMLERLPKKVLSTEQKVILDEIIREGHDAERVIEELEKKMGEFWNEKDN